MTEAGDHWSLAVGDILRAVRPVSKEEIYIQVCALVLSAQPHSQHSYSDSKKCTWALEI